MPPLKRNHEAIFTFAVIERTIQPPAIVHHKWLDFGHTGIDWGEWDEKYAETLERRAERGTPSMDSEKAERLVTLAEMLIYHLTMTNTYFGSVELQLVTHSMISFSLENGPGENWPFLFGNAISEMCDKTGAIDKWRFHDIANEMRRRVGKLHSPVVDGRYLCYPVGKVMGIDQISHYW
jgi:hypothetical protein